MAKFAQFRFHEQVFGSRKLPQPLRPISRHRIPLGVQVRKSLSGKSFPKKGKYKKEITYRYSKNNQMRYRYAVYNIPSAPKYDVIWLHFSTAVFLWQEMNAIERKTYNDRANIKGGLSGYNLFIGEYIDSHY